MAASQDEDESAGSPHSTREQTGRRKRRAQLLMGVVLVAFVLVQVVSNLGAPAEPEGRQASENIFANDPDLPDVPTDRLQEVFTATYAELASRLVAQLEDEGQATALRAEYRAAGLDLDAAQDLSDTERRHAAYLAQKMWSAGTRVYPMDVERMLRQMEAVDPKR